MLSIFLTQGMFMAFSQALRFNRTLQHLDVDLFQVTGTAWVSSILLYNSTLHTLVLREWRPSLLEPLASSLPSNTTLRHLAKMNLSKMRVRCVYGHGVLTCYGASAFSINKKISRAVSFDTTAVNSHKRGQHDDGCMTHISDVRNG